MKTLLLMRHAKSSWANPGLDDFDRPLNKRGRHDAPRMGAWLAANDLVPALVVCSSAVRARETTERVVAALGHEVSVRHRDDLYLASGSEIISVIAEADDVTPILVVGHNPGMETAITILTGEVEAMPTAAVAVIDLLDDDWRRAAGATCELRELWRPRELAGELS